MLDFNATSSFPALGWIDDVSNVGLEERHVNVGDDDCGVSTAPRASKKVSDSLDPSSELVLSANVSNWLMRFMSQNGILEISGVIMSEKPDTQINPKISIVGWR